VVCELHGRFGLVALLAAGAYAAAGVATAESEELVVAHA